jgi:uncharacterized protein YjdB
MKRFHSKAVATMRAFAAVATLLAVAACEDSTGPVGGTAIDRVEVIVLPFGTATTNLPRGITVQLLAAPANAANNFVDVPVTWSSSDETRATVDNTGKVTTVGGGDVTISAAAGGKTGTFDINVQYPVGSVAVGAPAGSIRQEGTVDLDATLLDTQGAAAVGRSIQWSSSNTAIATVNSSGVVSGVADGTVTITATSEGVSGTTQVTVSGAPLVASVSVSPGTAFRGVGQTLQMSHTSRAASGNSIAGTTATWSSSNTGVATVDVNGLVTFVAPGTATITASVDNGVGTQVTGTGSVEGATVLANGATITVPDVASEAFKDYAFVSNGTVASFTVVTSGGSSGDSDMHIFAPGVVPAFDANNFTYTNFVCRPWDVGSDETCTINAPAAGTYRIRFYNYPDAGVLTGMQATLTHP